MKGLAGNALGKANEFSELVGEGSPEEEAINFYCSQRGGISCKWCNKIIIIAVILSGQRCFQPTPTACIDEAVGRRVARLNGLSVTGSVGILLKAKQYNPSLSIQTAIDNMLAHNIRLSQRVIDFCLQEAGESGE